MAGEIIRPSALPNRASPVASEKVPVDNGVTVGGATIEALVLAGRPTASQAEAEAGTDAAKAMTPLTVKQSIYALGDVRFASAAQGALADAALQSVVGSSEISVDDTDPQNPVISYTGSGVADGDKGDITVTASGTAWNVNDGAIVPSNLDASESSGFANIIVGDTHINIDVRYAGAANDTALIQAALDNADVGAVLHFAPRLYSLNDQLNMSKVQSLEAFGASIWAIGLAAGKSVLDIKIQSAGIGSTNGRGMTIKGGNWYTDTGDHAFRMNSTTGATGSSNNTTGYPLLDAWFSDLLMEGKVSALRMIGVDNHFNKISNCAITNGVWLDRTGDGNQIINNTIAGSKPGVVVDLVSGAFDTIIGWNAIVGNGGGVDLQNGDLVLIIGNQFEQSATGTFLTGSHILVRGVARIARNNRILLNNFGGGGFISTNITLFNARYTAIDENQFNLATAQDVNFSNAAGAGLEANYNTIGSKNGFRGTRALQAPSGNTGTDINRRMVINDVGQGNRGVWKAASLLTLANSWAVSGAGCRWMISEAGDFCMDGSLTAGTKTALTKIMTLPVGTRPFQEMILPFPEATGAMKSVYINAANGEVLLNEAIVGATAYPQPIRFPANYMNTYEVGP